jgi:hypothetical protein
MPLHAMFEAVLGKATGHELPTMIGAKGSNLPSRLSLGTCLECIERAERLIPHGQEHKPHEPAYAVN